MTDIGSQGGFAIDRGGTSQKIHPDYSLMFTRPEIECSHALVRTVSNHVNKNGGSRERNIQIKIVVKLIKI